MSEQDKTVQGAFEAPPAGAPAETTQPLSQALVDAQIATARANERELPPFNPQPGAPVPDESPEPPASRLTEAVQALHQGTPRAQQPAASDSDSPSRGMPRPIADPGKQITGGFGLAGEAQYYPLDGNELRELVRGLMDLLNDRIQNDLRFHPAITYPRVACRVVLEVEGYSDKGNFQIVQHLLPGKGDKTPLEIARTKGDEVCFCVIASRQEFSPEGESLDPPDKLRDELGLPKPRKQMVQAGAGRQLVDVTPDNSF